MGLPSATRDSTTARERSTRARLVSASTTGARPTATWYTCSSDNSSPEICTCVLFMTLLPLSNEDTPYLPVSKKIVFVQRRYVKTPSARTETVERCSTHDKTRWQGGGGYRSWSRDRPRERRPSRCGR